MLCPVCQRDETLRESGLCRRCEFWSAWPLLSADECAFRDCQSVVYCRGLCVRHFNESKVPAPPKVKPECGSLAAYRGGCRCNRCRAANRGRYSPKSRVRQSSQYYKANRDRIIAYAHEQHAKRKAVFRERVDLAQLAIRDKDRCGVCGALVQAKDRSIDHILPVSRGGEHSYANTRLTHVRCNLSRGNRGEAQLRMLGGTE